VAIALIDSKAKASCCAALHRGGEARPKATLQGEATLEWCERRLLARIHRYTIKTLRAEIEPVSSADFMRFLLEWQGVTRQPGPRASRAWRP
jgi:ATP-dependent Lhr-like helicase